MDDSDLVALDRERVAGCRVAIAVLAAGTGIALAAVVARPGIGVAAPGIAVVGIAAGVAVIAGVAGIRAAGRAGIGATGGAGVGTAAGTRIAAIAIAAAVAVAGVGGGHELCHVAPRQQAGRDHNRQRDSEAQREVGKPFAGGLVHSFPSCRFHL